MVLLHCTVGRELICQTMKDRLDEMKRVEDDLQQWVCDDLQQWVIMKLMMYAHEAYPVLYNIFV